MLRSFQGLLSRNLPFPGELCVGDTVCMRERVTSLEAPPKDMWPHQHGAGLIPETGASPEMWLGAEQDGKLDVEDRKSKE